MFRDIKLNSLQWSKDEIEKKYKIYMEMYNNSESNEWLSLNVF